uniref:Uncharacterized protein n=1 Tax=Cacopsylla melanoneura TaxID=428564 RepID=A0A8D8WWU5_9HEMI
MEDEEEEEEDGVDEGSVGDTKSDTGSVKEDVDGQTTATKSLADFLNIKFDKDNKIIIDKDMEDKLKALKVMLSTTVGTTQKKRKRRWAQIFDYGNPGDFEKFNEMIQEREKENRRHEIFSRLNMSETIGYGENLIKAVEAYVGSTYPNFLSTNAEETTHKSERRKKRSADNINQEWRLREN